MPLTETLARQAAASDPSACAWVSANAGTGKTTVLVRRFVRALLAGAPPDAILCLTFTKAAAMEMSNRLLEKLSAWPAMAEDELGVRLCKELGREAGAEEQEIARTLFARVLDAPGGLKIMTIHSFCDGVLRRFPLEAGVAPGFTLFTDAEAQAARDQAGVAALELAASRGGPLGDALGMVVAYAGEESFHGLLRQILGRKILSPGMQDFGPPLRQVFGLNAGDTPDRLLGAQSALCPDALLASASVLCESDKVTDRNLGDALAAAQRAAPGRPRLEALALAFLTAGGEPRSDLRFITKGMQKQHPGMTDALRSARNEFARLEQQRRAAETVTASAALFRLASVAAAHYERIKAERNALDYQDLIERASALLSHRGASWVLYRLDAAIRHVLVDEAQDTNPEQWTIVSRLTQDFFSGEGAAEGVRTVFAVGDEKQSIFGFQGADPTQFAIAGERFRDIAAQCGVKWQALPLTLSFRTVTPVLQAVDEVLSAIEDFSGAQPHAAFRVGDAGLVELWPAETAVQAEKGDAWTPLDDASADLAPTMRLAERIAGTIREWLDNGELLVSQGRPVEPGDILILLRKRAPFAGLITRALRQRGVPVAGADRLTLSNSIAVLDLLALGEVLLQPLDDLGLACVLKSPLVGWNDDDLYALGLGRAGSLWQALRESQHAGIADTLERWRADAAYMPPFEFYAARLDADGLRQRFVAALGTEAGDAIDELLNLALTYGETAAPSLQGFLHLMRSSTAEIKRDLDAARGEVRVMTVHGAKGLEAPIVFLADTCSAKNRGGSSIIELPAGTGTLPVWAIPAAKNLLPVQQVRDEQRRKDAAEYRRLLYVAMTRARDRLYVTGFEGTKGRDHGCWYDLVRAGLTAIDGAVTLPDDRIRLECRQTAAVKAEERPRAVRDVTPLPAWAAVPAPREPAGPRKLRPSSAVEYTPAGGTVHRQAFIHAALRGEFFHRLLELAPDTPQQYWPLLGKRLLRLEAPDLPADIANETIDKALTLLTDLSFQHLFDYGSRAEVSVRARFQVPGSRQVLEISGRIDRLAETPHGVLIVDYKTGAVPHSPAGIPRLYLIQLASYRAALRKIFGGRMLHAAILWTEAPLLMEIPAADLDAAEARLIEQALDFAPAPLDGGQRCS
jgi:ATP-dependent helicase/nuclease subunit A